MSKVTIKGAKPSPKPLVAPNKGGVTKALMQLIAPAVEPAEPSEPTTKKVFDVVMMAPQLLKPYYRNNKLHGAKNTTLLARILRTYGFDQPIVVDKDNVIIKGHGRHQAAMEANLPTVPVVVRDDLEEWQIKAARIADNRSFSLSDIDQTKAREEISQFVKNGGVGAEFFFDFLNPPAKGTDPASKGGISDASTKTDVGGLLVTCPKCAHVQMEAVK